MDLSTVTLTYDHFKTILTELFTHGGITREKIVILFFFCSDLAVKAYHNSYVSYCITLLSWSLRFIFDFVCDWVQSRGGWVNMISSCLRSAFPVWCPANALPVLFYGHCISKQLQSKQQTNRSMFWTTTYRSCSSLRPVFWAVSLWQST